MEAYQCCPDLHVFRADHFRLGSPLLGGHSMALHQGVKPCSISLLHIGLSTAVVLAGLMRAGGLFRVHGSSLSVLSRKYDYITVTPVLSFTHHLSLTPPPLCRPSYLSFFFFPSHRKTHTFRMVPSLISQHVAYLPFKSPIILCSMTFSKFK